MCIAARTYSVCHQKSFYSKSSSFITVFPATAASDQDR